MAVRDPKGEFEAEVALVHSHTDRYDDDEDYKFTLKDLRTGEIVQTEHFRSSYAFNTGIQSGSAPEGVHFTPDGKYVEIRFSKTEYDRYPLPGRVTPPSSVRSDGRLKLELEMTRDSREGDKYDRVYELRLLDPATGEVLKKDTRIASWGRKVGAQLQPIERIEFSPLFPGVCTVLSDGKTELKFPGLREEMTLAPGDLRSPSGKRAARLQTGRLDPKSSEKRSLVLVWDAESGGSLQKVWDRGLDSTPALIKEIHFASEEELFIRYEDGTHRTALVGPVDLKFGSELPFPADAPGKVAYVDGEFIRIVYAPKRELKKSIYIPDQRKVNNLEFSDGDLAYSLRVTYEDGGVEKFVFDFLQDVMKVEKKRP